VDGINSEQVDASSSVCPDGIIGICTLWRRAHQAAAQTSHIKRKSQL
jgi:hypothetical protein